MFKAHVLVGPCFRDNDLQRAFVIGSAEDILHASCIAPSSGDLTFPGTVRAILQPCSHNKTYKPCSCRQLTEIYDITVSRFLLIFSCCERRDAVNGVLEIGYYPNLDTPVDDEVRNQVRFSVHCTDTQT